MKKYFPRVFGNEDTVRRIGAAVESQRIPHAFLILGPAGSGKTTLALEIAAALNCEGGTDTLPCGRCSACKRIYEGNFTDIKVLSKPRDKATVGVSAVKEFREDMFLSATESDYKIYLFKDAECMTVEAQNALLKVLEEPPKGVIMILLATEGDKILTTIKSRAQSVNMARFHRDRLKEILLECSYEARELARVSSDRLDSVVMGADGRIGEAIRLMDKRLSDELAEEREDIMRLLRAIRHGTPFSELYAALSGFPQKRPELLAFLELLLSALRDMIVQRYDSGSGLLFFMDRDECEALSAKIGSKRAYEAYEAVCEAHRLCYQNANTTNIITALAARLKPG